MKELIDKNAMLDRFKKVYERNKEYSVANGLAMAYDMIQGQPTVEAIPQWIPVSERLPEHDDDVLVTVSCRGFKYVSFDRYLLAKEEWQNWDDKFKVLAWMEIPNPYRGEK